MLAASLAAGPTQAQAPEGLESLMGARAFRAGGLHRLSPDELDYLESWFRARGYLPPADTGAAGAEGAAGAARRSPGASEEGRAESAATAPAVTAEARQPVASTSATVEAPAPPPGDTAPRSVRYPDEAPDFEPYEARVLDPFEGWSGDTVFRLDNGQVWQQRLRGRFNYPGDDRRVRIEKNFLGFFKLVHIESGRSVGIAPLR